MNDFDASRKVRPPTAMIARHLDALRHRHAYLLGKPDRKSYDKGELAALQWAIDSLSSQATPRLGAVAVRAGCLRTYERCGFDAVAKTCVSSECPMPPPVDNRFVADGCEQF